MSRVEEAIVPSDAPTFTFRGPWFSAKEAAAYIPCKSVKAFYDWRNRHHIVPRSNGSVAKADLDRALRVPRKKHRMSAASLANLKKRHERRRERHTDESTRRSA